MTTNITKFDIILNISPSYYISTNENKSVTMLVKN